MKNSNKKVYLEPQVRTEIVSVGIYGDYGSNGNDDGGDDGCSWTPVQFLNPLFHWCCS